MDINSFIKYLGKSRFQCDMCGSHKVNSPYYELTGMLTGIKCKICQSCGLREGFGSKYKQNSKYKQWLDKKGENNGLRKKT